MKYFPASRRGEVLRARANIDHALVAAALAWPALLTRALSVHAQIVDFQAWDLRGFVIDMTLALFWSTVLCLLRGKARKVATFAAILLCSLASLGNYEHVKANGAVLDLRFFEYMFSGAFFQGSVEGSVHVPLLMAVLLPPFALAFIASRTAGGLGYSRVLATASLVLTALSFVLPMENDVATWRQTNIFVENGSRLVATAQAAWSPSSDQVQNGQVPDAVRKMFRQDLDGRHRWGAAPVKARNVLFITLESLPQDMLELRSANGSGPIMPFLAQLARTHVSFQNFVGQQRQTNRGQYALLCGDFPNMATTDAKMDLYWESPDYDRAECLPRLFARKGYHTTYLQSAPITFMDKDKFMSKAGFVEVLDTKWFGSSLEHSGWGVDDQTFLDGVARKVSELDKKGEPWFMNVLTSGTHHPYPIPNDWKGISGLGEAADAFAFLDHGLSRLFQELGKTSVLDNTLIIITADESAGVKKSDSVAESLTHNHIPFVLVSPDLPQDHIKDFYAQNDVALSLADYFGLDASKTAFKGRSVFRSYDEDRLIPFANVYFNRVYLLWDPELVTMCEAALESCVNYKGHVFGGPFAEGAALPEDVQSVRALVKLNDKTSQTSIDQPYLLTSEKSMKLQSKDERQSMFLSRSYTLPENYLFEVSLRLKVTDGAIFLQHDIVAEGASVKVQEFPRLFLSKGMELNWVYQLPIRAPVERLEFRTFGWNSFGTEATVEILDATVKLQKGITPKAKEPSRPVRYEVKSSEDQLVIDAMAPGFLAWDPCTKRLASGVVHVEACGRRTVAYGPYVPLPRGTKVKASFSLAGRSEATSVYLDMLDDSGKMVVKRGDETVITSQSPTTIELEARMPKQTKALEARLNVAEDEDRSFDIEKAEFTIVFPRFMGLL